MGRGGVIEALLGLKISADQERDRADEATRLVISLVGLWPMGGGKRRSQESRAGPNPVLIGCAEQILSITAG